MKYLTRSIKRFADLLLAGIGIILLSPLLAVIALLIKCTSRGSVFFIQERVGLRGRPFHIYKFRTMLELRDAEGRFLPDQQRINTIGRFLRATSLDELPQLLNILQGQMSFIGPRPLPTSYLPRYSSEQMRRHEVLPGMASYADVILNRSVPDWETVFKLEVWYVNNWTLWLDLRIFVRIAVMVLLRRGAEQGANGQMPEFLPIKTTDGNRIVR